MAFALTQTLTYDYQPLWLVPKTNKTFHPPDDRSNFCIHSSGVLYVPLIPIPIVDEPNFVSHIAERADCLCPRKFTILVKMIKKRIKKVTEMNLLLTLWTHPIVQFCSPFRMLGVHLNFQFLYPFVWPSQKYFWRKFFLWSEFPVVEVNELI